MLSASLNKIFPSFSFDTAKQERRNTKYIVTDMERKTNTVTSDINTRVEVIRIRIENFNKEKSELNEKNI